MPRPMQKQQKDYLVMRNYLHYRIWKGRYLFEKPEKHIKLRILCTLFKLIKYKIWWRRGELNPRPQVLRHKVYMLISLFNLADDYPSSQENHQRFRKVLAHPHRTDFSAILCR